jgi:hypothetical protein
MEWSDEEYEELALAQGREATPAERRASLEAVASRAVELAAARSGLTVAHDAAMVRARLNRIIGAPHAADRPIYEALDRLAASGARSAALEAELLTVRGERAEWMERTKTLEVWRDNAMSSALGANKRAKELRARAEHAEARVRELAIAGQALSEHVDRTTGGCDCAATGIACIHCARRAAPYPERHPHAFVRPPHGGAGCWSEVASGGRCAWPEDAHVVGTSASCFPCSPTCTHDDAAMPGHPERVKERSEAFMEQTTREARTYDDGKCHGFVDGAEAMRAACWEAIQPLTHSMSEHERQQFKAAIEGARRDYA